MMHHPEKILPWFALKSVAGIGNLLIKRLIDRLDSPERVFQATSEELLQVDGMSPRLVRSIRQHQTPDSARRDFDLAMAKGFGIITMADSGYPRLLREIPDPPPFLFVSGSLQDDPKPLAVVGSRNATRYGLSTTRKLCADLASLGFTIVSGMAKGIDTAAHEGALMGAGRTIAVLGSGLENIYPPENRKLAGRIAENGAVVSEFSPLAGPDAHHFPVRNRIISGIAYGTVIVEATLRSGSLITARLAAEQGRDVFAVPGSIQSFKSTGTHGLIKQGAKLVEHAQDIVEELPHLSNPPAASAKMSAEPAAPQLPKLSAEEYGVFSALEPYPLHIDDLVRKLSMKPGKAAGILLKLELMGIVQQFPGKYFSKEDLS
ncbi:MAG: DNA-processing protein DprA [Desulfobacterales bacterium]|nr:DNA-processing protein DprA [Desulfobacterales bacterium]